MIVEVMGNSGEGGDNLLYCIIIDDTLEMRYHILTTVGIFCGATPCIWQICTNISEKHTSTLKMEAVHNLNDSKQIQLQGADRYTQSKAHENGSNLRCVLTKASPAE